MHRLAAVRLDRRRDARVVGRHEDAIDAARAPRALVHVLDHRHAGDVEQRLAGKTRRLESGGDDGDSAGVRGEARAS